MLPLDKQTPLKQQEKNADNARVFFLFFRRRVFTSIEMELKSTFLLAEFGLLYSGRAEFESEREKNAVGREQKRESLLRSPRR